MPLERSIHIVPDVAVEAAPQHSLHCQVGAAWQDAGSQKQRQIWVPASLLGTKQHTSNCDTGLALFDLSISDLSA